MQIISVEQRIYVGSIGITIDLVVCNYNYEPVNLTTLMGTGGAATVVMQKPDGTVVTKSATITGTGSNIIRFTSVAGDFDDAGTYSVHGVLTTTVSSVVTKKIYTEPQEFQVRNLFDEEEPPAPVGP